MDYAGPTVEVTDRRTGEVQEARVFVGVLAASNHTFVDVTMTRSPPDWTASHVRMFEHWGGVPELLIPDNEKAAVRRASRYESDVNRTYHDLAVHYGTAALPARPRSPQDKAKVEAAVQNVGRWVLAPLRNHRFFSLSEVREAIAPLLAALNERPFQKIEGSRRSLFEDLDRPALKPLPPDRYEYAEWRKARVNIDYHIQVDGRFYSVPHALARRDVEVRLASTTVEIFHRHRRVAAHIRGRGRGGYTTDPGHMPAAHRAHLEWTPSRLVRWARKTGPDTAAFARKLLESRPHPEQGYRSCLGLMRLARAYPAERLEAACRRALHIGAFSYKSVNTIWPPASIRPTRASKGRCPCPPITRTSADGLLRQLPQRKGVVTNMLRQPTFDLLHELRLTGMAQAFEEQLAIPDIGELAFDLRLDQGGSTPSR